MTECTAPGAALSLLMLTAVTTVVPGGAIRDMAGGGTDNSLLTCMVPDPVTRESIPEPRRRISFNVMAPDAVWPPFESG